MKRTPSSCRRATAALVFASCMSETQPSCMRAPPDAEIARNGSFRSRANSAPRVIASPTPPPMLPPMNAKSMIETTSGCPPIVAVPYRAPSRLPVLRSASASRCAYGFESANCNASTGSMSPLKSTKLPSSSSVASRSCTGSRKW